MDSVEGSRESPSLPGTVTESPGLFFSDPAQFCVTIPQQQQGPGGPSPAEPAPRETRWSGTRGLASKPVDSPPATGVSVFCSATRGRGNAICVTAQRSGFTAMAYVWLTGSAWRLEHRNIRQQPRARPAPRPRPFTLLGGWDRARCRPSECARVCVCTHTRVRVRPAGPRHRPAASVSHSTAVPGPGGPRVPTSSPSQPRMPDGGRQRPGPQSGLWLRTVLPSSALSVSA